MSTRRRTGLRPPQRKPTQEAAPGQAHTLRIVAAIVANTTLLTALLYYFGLVATQVFFAHFRVHYTLLRQGTDEILGRGADGLFLPLAAIAGAVLATALTVRLLRTRLSARQWSALLRVATPVAGVAGFGLLCAVVPMVTDPGLFPVYPGLAGIGFALGVLLLVVAWRRWTAAAGPTRVVESAITFLLVSVGLFWAVGDYSGAVSVRRGHEVEARIPAMPSVVVYSARSLRLTGVHETTCASADAAYRYRYDGLKLLLQSGGQYVFVPATWHRADGTAYVVPESGSLRLEFGPPPRVPPPTC
jgi:hypothetical protein